MGNSKNPRLEKLLRDDRPWEPPQWFDWVVSIGYSVVLVGIVHFVGFADENGPPPLSEMWWIYLILFILGVAFYWAFTVFPRRKLLQMWDRVKGEQDSGNTA